VAQSLGQLNLKVRRRTFVTALAFLGGFAPWTVLAEETAPQPPIISGWARALPTTARHGMVASQETRATQIGVEILRSGGNAVDAAVAVGFALAVTLPRAGNLGGGGFMLVHLKEQGRTVAIDYRETAPAALRPDAFLDEAGRFVPARAQSSGLGVGVPGAVAGLALAHARYGSGKFSLSQLIAPAEALARAGVPVDGDLADSLPQAARRLARYASSREIFFREDGQIKGHGDVLVQRDLADVLKKISERGPAGFYEGDIAERIVKSVRDSGGVMSHDDLKSYAAVERIPLKGSFRNRDVYVMPPPSSGGVHVLQLLNLLEPYPLAAMGHNSANVIHLMAEAMKLAYADRAQFLGDPDFHKNPVSALISKRYANDLRHSIDPASARPSASISAGDVVPYESDQTTHFSIVDRDGNAVANTYTLNFSYGLGQVVEGAGFLLNNELDDFAARADAPNAYGMLGGAANAPAPRKRPLSSMSPTIMTKDGAVELVTGSPGGSRIITIVLQTILNIFEHDMNVAEAASAPRIHHQLHPDEIRVERGVSADTIRLLEQMGHKVKVQPTIGSVQSILRRDGWLMGASDPRQRGSSSSGY
jgi:gamma-glutamyltranspeptidase/glutathione hydrolase